MEYILKRELEELLFDFEDERIHDVVKRRWKKDIKSFFVCFEESLMQKNVFVT